MKAGLLDRRITLQRGQVTRDAYGEEVSEWVDVATVWARKVEAPGSERFLEQQRIGRTVKTFIIRWSAAVAAVTVEWRLMFDGREYDITDVREVGRREGLELDAYARGEEAVTVAP